MESPPPYRTGRLVAASVIGGVLGGSAAAAIALFEYAVTRLDEWSAIVDIGRSAIAIATPVALLGGAAFGLLVALAAKPIARVPARTVRLVLYTAIFAAGFAVFAGVALATGQPPLRPFAAVLIVGAGVLCGAGMFGGFDRRPADPGVSEDRRVASRG